MNRTELTRRSRKTASTIILMMFALAPLAGAETAKPHKGSLTLKTQTTVLGTTLPAGNYEVRERHTEQGPTVEFIRKYWNEAASEMVSAEEDQVLSQVPVVEQPLSAPARHTQLELSQDHATANALQIRGVAVDFVFESPQSAHQSVEPSSTNTIGSN